MTIFTKVIPVYFVSLKPTLMIVQLNTLMKSWINYFNDIYLAHLVTQSYKVSKVNIIEVIDIPSIIEILPIVLEVNKETFLLVIMCHGPGPVGSFIDNFTLLMNGLPIQHRILILGDFNLDQIFPENVSNNPNIVSVLPSPCSDHFVLFFLI